MSLDFLPDCILSNIKKYDIEKIYNIRLRINQPILINYNFQTLELLENDTDNDKKQTIICSENDILQIIDKVTKRSIYAFNEKIKNGFINAEDGVRIGICGECVFDKNGIVTIKNFSSLNIRIPHQIDGCANKIYNVLNKNLCQNILIISPPFCGKTTLLKDLAKKIDKQYNKNIFIIDERGEFLTVNGRHIDSVRYCDKLFAFEYGIRVMSPDIVITDELMSESDWQLTKKAVNSGVKIIASCHADSLNSLMQKDYFIPNIFDKYVVLKNYVKPGEIEGIFDKKGNPL